MATPVERIFHRIKELRIRDVEFAVAIGESPQTVNNWKRRGSIPLRKFPLIAKVLSLSMDDLIPEPKFPVVLRENASPYKSSGAEIQKVPLISMVNAGDFSPTHDPFPVGNGDGEIDVPYPVGPRSFALRIQGDSMREEFHPGDIIVIDPDATAKAREPVVAKRDEDDEATFKLYVPRGIDDHGVPIIELLPLNPYFHTLVINAEHPGRIIGPMVARIQGRRTF